MSHTTPPPPPQKPRRKLGEPDITLFVDTTRSFSRLDLNKPFTVNGWRYATNGIIAVRVPDIRKNSRGKYPTVEKLFFADFSQCSKPVPASTSTPCECRFNCDKSAKLSVWGRTFCPRFVALIRALPGVRIGRPIRLSAKKKSGFVLPFIADGGLQGLLMEVAKE